MSRPGGSTTPSCFPSRSAFSPTAWYLAFYEVAGVGPEFLDRYAADVKQVTAAAELYGHWLTYRGRPRPLNEWVAWPALLNEEATRACRDLAERLTDEGFLLYLPSRQQWGVR
jgi:hypothetical protein